MVVQGSLLLVACGAFLSDKERVEEKRQIPPVVEQKSGEEPEVCLWLWPFASGAECFLFFHISNCRFVVNQYSHCVGKHHLVFSFVLGVSWGRVA